MQNKCEIWIGFPWNWQTRMTRFMTNYEKRFIVHIIYRRVCSNQLHFNELLTYMSWIFIISFYDQSFTQHSYRLYIPCIYFIYDCWKRLVKLDRSYRKLWVRILSSYIAFSCSINYNPLVIYKFWCGNEKNSTHFIF